MINALYMYILAMHIANRRFVKSTISDLGHPDFSEWFIGHNGSTYYRKKESEKAEIFRKVEPYLTFLDFAKLEAKGADVETKLQDKDKQIQTMMKNMICCSHKYKQ